MAHDPSKWLTVAEVAAVLGVSTETIRGKIKAGELPASRASNAPRAAWLIDAAEFERQREAEVERAAVRQRLGGVVSSYGDDEFIEKLKARYPDATVDSPDGPTLAEHVRARIARHELLDRVEHEMAAEMADDSAISERFEDLDEEQRFEEEARELARRVRRAERLRERALEILEEEED
jgi:excisionase family DNA binding protein